MALRTWSSAGSTDMNLATNYSGAGALLVTDDLVWDGTSVINSTATAPLSVATITVAVGYTGIFNDGGFAMQTSGAVSITPGGTFTCTGTWTQTGNANFTVADAGAHNTTTMSVVLQGTGTLSWPKAAARMANLTCAALGKVTTISAFGGGGGAGGGMTSSMTIGAGVLTMNAANMRSYVAAGFALTVDPAATINGNGLWYILNNGPGGTNVNIPAMTIGGTVTFVLAKFSTISATSFTLTGNLSVASSFRVYHAFNNAGSSLTFNTGGNAVTVGAGFSHGNQIASGSFIANFGASVIGVAAFCTTAYNGVGTTTLNMGTSVWTCTGVWTTQTNHTIVPGTSVINFTGLNSTFTTAGKNFGGIVSNKNAGQTLTQAGALNCAAFTVAGGNFTSGNNAITASGNVLMGGGTLNLGTSAITCTGNAITARISATTRTTATSVWTFSGTSAILDLANAGATTISRLILQAAAAYTWTATANVLTITIYVAGDWDSTTWTSGTPGTSAAILAPAGVVVIGMTVTDSNNSGAVIDATAATNTDGGGNAGWAFPRGASRLKSTTGISTGVGVGI